MDITKHLRRYENYGHIPGKENVWGEMYTPEEAQVSSVSYGDIKPDEAGQYIEVPYSTYSDYSGDTVNRANCAEFLRLFGELDGVYPIYGGYSTAGVLIRRSLYEQNTEVKDVIDALDDYPLINEETMSEIEMEIENESWDSWIKSDLTRELEKIEEPSDLIIKLLADDELLEHSFYFVMDKVNEYFIHEDAVNVYIHLDRILPGYDGLCHCKEHGFYYNVCERCQPKLTGL